jgi:hypothetical protein
MDRKWMASWLIMGLVCVIGVSGCCTSKSSSDDDDTATADSDEDSPKKKKKKKKRKKTAKAETTPTADTPPKPVVPPTINNVVPPQPTPQPNAGGGLDAKGVPAIPETRSAPPTLAEWGSAPDVNTQGAGSRPSWCTMKVLREWLKVNCASDISSFSHMSGFGREGVDYFKYVRWHEKIDFVVRIHRGSMTVRIHRPSGDRASLFVSWSGSADRPQNIALAYKR